MITPGRRHHDDGQHDRHPVKPDRWLVGLLAGTALMFLAGRLLGLGQSPRRARR